MSEVKRYMHSDQHDSVEAHRGYVLFEDYEALEKKLNALAIENAKLKSACGGSGEYRDCPACTHSQYIESPETPVTDSALNAIRAEGAMLASERIRKAVRVFKETHHGAVNECADIAANVAERFQSGEK